MLEKSRKKCYNYRITLRIYYLEDIYKLGEDKKYEKNNNIHEKLVIYRFSWKPDDA